MKIISYNTNINIKYNLSFILDAGIILKKKSINLFNSSYINLKYVYISTYNNNFYINNILNNNFKLLLHKYEIFFILNIKNIIYFLPLCIYVNKKNKIKVQFGIFKKSSKYLTYKNLF